MSATLARVVDPEDSITAWRTDPAVAVEVLVETGFEQLRTQSCFRTPRGLREEIAAAVGVQHEVLIGAAVLPGDLIAAGRLLRADRHPRPELAHRDRRAGHLQLRTGGGRGIEKIVVRDLA